MREQLKDSYSDTGRPSIDPELLLRILLIGYLYGITSERKLVEELRMHLAWRWFTGLGFDQEIPHHSTFSKNRHGRFQESKLFEELFEQIVRQCMEVGLVQGKHLSVDGSFVEANAAKESRIPREQLAEAAQVNHTVRQYLVELEEQNPVEEPVHRARSGVDHRSRFHLRHQGWHAGPAGVLRQLPGRQSQLRDRGRASHGGTHEPGDGGRTRHAHPLRAMARTKARIGGGRHDLREWGVSAMVGGSEHHALHANPRQYSTERTVPCYGPERFTYQPESNSYLCPAGQQLNYGGRNVRNRAHAYIGSAQTLWGMLAKSAMHQRSDSSILPSTCMNRPGNAHGSWRTRPSSPRHSGKERRWKPCLRNSRIRSGCAACACDRLKFVREQFFLAAAAQNIKRLVRFLSQPTAPLAVTT